MVNGSVVTNYKFQVFSWDFLEILDFVKYHEVKLLENKKTKIVLFNKPKWYVVSKSDVYNKTIFEILPDYLKDFYYLGRLDKDSHGLLVLTNDSKMVNDWSHPSFGVEKEYLVQVNRKIGIHDLQKMLKWVESEWDFLNCKVAKVLDADKLCLILLAGKKRHIRRMLMVLWYDVLDLKRVREWNYVLWDIKVGEFKEIIL